MVFAFGIGGPAANFGGLLHMVMHSVTKSAIFFSVGHIAQIKGTQRIDDIRGMTTSQPMLGWGLVAGAIAIIGLPPFGLFSSEFIILTAAYAHHPFLALMGGIGLLLAFGAILLRVTHMAFGKPTANIASINISQVPLLLHLLIALMAGLYLPPHLVSWFQNIAHQLG
jgi:hydrogenase-4 component F